MTLVLCRVDQRLLHGQVVIGWGSQLRPDRYVVVDDELAVSEWEQELYRLAVSDGAEVEFLPVTEATGRLATLREAQERTVLLTRDVDTMVRLSEEGGLQGQQVNLGGIHYAEGAIQVKSYLFLSDADLRGVRRLTEKGAVVTGRDLPDSSEVDLDDLLEEDGHD